MRRPGERHGGSSRAIRGRACGGDERVRQCASARDQPKSACARSGRGSEVIDSHAAAFGGRQGRLSISGRFLLINGERVRIHGMEITAAGQNHANTALAVSMIPYAGIAGIFVHGGNIEIPVGARGAARLGAAVSLPTLSALPRTQDNQPTH